MLADMNEDIAFDCQGVDIPEQLDADPLLPEPILEAVLFTRAEWRQVIESFQEIPVYQLEINRLRDQMMKKAAPASLAEILRATDSSQAVRTLTNLFESMRRLGLAPNAPRPAEFNDPLVQLLDEAGARVSTERFGEFCKKRAADRVQLMRTSADRVPWAWDYINSSAAAWAKACESIAVAAVTPDIMTLLTVKIVWPADPNTEVDLRAFRVRVGLLYLASLSRPELWLRVYELFWTATLAAIVDVRHTKFLSQGSNLADHKIWAADQSKKTARASGSGSNDIQIKGWKERRDMKRKPGTEQAASRDKYRKLDGDAHAGRKLEGDANSGLVPKQAKPIDKPAKTFTKCSKCGKPSPHGRPVASPLCIICRET
jgi:hypothetical protein